MSEVLTPQTLSASEAVVGRIATYEGIDPAELSPLYDAIDPDALDAFIEGADRRETSAEIQFSYHGYTVTVSSDGSVTVDDGITARR